jgi:3'(2'),5'-bisphosphate nucleotidase
MSFPPPLESLISLAVAAGREVMAVYDSGAEAVAKADGSPVTQADQRAEAVILKGLAELAPGVPVVAEEEWAAGRTPSSVGARFFCVDPLDGTRDFIARRAEFTVNIAAIEHGIPTKGVVFAPASGVLYAGEPGRAMKAVWDARSTRNIETAKPIGVTSRSGPWRVTASRRSGLQRTEAFLEALGDAIEKPSSSSVKFCWIAEGDVDLYPRFGNVHEWDAAAGHAVLSAAGGGLMRLDGAPVTYGRSDRNFLIDGFVAFGDAAAEAEARRILAFMPPDAESAFA